MSLSNSASSTSMYSLTLFPSRGSTEDFTGRELYRRVDGDAVDRAAIRRAERAMLATAATIGQNGGDAVLEAPRAGHAPRGPDRPEDRRQVRTIVDLPDVPVGTEGKVILANGFNWLRYRVLFDNGAEIGDLDHRHIEPIGRAAKRLAKRAKVAARGR